MAKEYTKIKKTNKFLVVLLGVVFSFGFALPIDTFAATTPTLGMASTYAVLSSTYTNTSITVINGDVGFVTPPATVPLGLHTNYGSGIPYATAGVDQGTTLSLLASEGCTFTFPGGAVNLSTDTTHGPISVYTPGVYCSSGAMNIGGPLTLNGNGTYIFRSNGALTSTAGAVVALSGASACDIFWTPTQATTLGANTTFIGNLISDAGITFGANSTLVGRALAFGGTVTSDTNTITAPECTAPSSSSVSGTLSGTVSSGSTVTGSLNADVTIADTVTGSSGGGSGRGSILGASTDSGGATGTNPGQVLGASTPRFPSTGFPPQERSYKLFIIFLSSISLFSLFLYFAQKKVLPSSSSTHE